MSDNRRIRFTIAIETEYDNNLINYGYKGVDRIRDVLNNQSFGYKCETGIDLPNPMSVPINEDIREIEDTEADTETRSNSHAQG